MDKLNIHQLKGIGNSIKNTIEENNIINKAMLSVIKNIEDNVENIDADNFVKLCIKEAMIIGKGRLNPGRVNEYIRSYII